MAESFEIATFANPKNNNRRWGIAVCDTLKVPGTKRILTAWGSAKVSKFQYKLRSFTIWPAIEYHTLINEKKAEGYEQTVDTALYNFLAENTLTKSKKDPICSFCRIATQDALTDQVFHSQAICTICKRRAGEHDFEHPHTSNGCVQFSLTPPEWSYWLSHYNLTPHISAWDLAPSTSTLTTSITFGTPITTNTSFTLQNWTTANQIYEDSQKFCCSDFHDALYAAEAKATYCTCGQPAKLHVRIHPHQIGRLYKNGCTAFKFPDPDAVPLETSPLKLLDLPCVCDHLLSLHKTYCLVSTCKCEAYRRLCAECGEWTRTVWRHRPNCLTGLQEKVQAEPVNEQNRVSPRKRPDPSLRRLLKPW
jgi:hypothetical protein